MEEVFIEMNKHKDINTTKERWKDAINGSDYWIEKTVSEFVKERETALIIGAGKCLDFSLDKFVHLFNQVDIIDIDYNSVSEAVANLPNEIRDRVNIITGDITGLIDNFINEAKEEYVENGIEGLLEISRKFRDGIPRTFKTDVLNNSAGKYNFIFSDSLTTQLFTPPVSLGILDEKEKIESFFDNNLTNEVLEIFSSTTSRLMGPYLRTLRNCLKKNGVLGIISDTYEINKNNRNYFYKKYGGLRNISFECLTNKSLMNDINNYIIPGGTADILREFEKRKNIKLKKTKVINSWPWDFADHQQYVVLATSFIKI